MHIAQLNHVAIHVADVERSVAFYRDVLRLVPIPRPGQYGLMTYLHQGKQYVILPVDGGYTAMALP